MTLNKIHKLKLNLTTHWDNDVMIVEIVKDPQHRPYLHGPSLLIYQST